MNKIYLLILFFLFTGNSYPINPPDSIFRKINDSKILESQLKNYSTSLKTFESNFIQIKTMSIFNKPDKSKGFFCYSADPMIRWEYNEPFKYLIIIRNNKIYITEKNETKSFNLGFFSMFSRLSMIMGKIIQGNFIDNSDDFIFNFFENNYLFKIELLPKRKKISDHFNKITIFFRKSPFVLTKIEMLEKSGDNTNIEFIDGKINQPINPEIFVSPNK